MKTIKRTQHANTPRSAAWVGGYGRYEPAPYADTAMVDDYPTHSPVLGPDGQALQYEPRPSMGFDLKPRQK